MAFSICSLFSGSSGNCTYIETENSAVLIDAGMSGKTVFGALDKLSCDYSKIKSILITHEHSDHIQSAGVISRKLDIPIIATEKTWAAMEMKLGNVKTKNQITISSRETFWLDDIEIESFKTPHDAADSIGYSFYINKKKMTIATDLGHTTKEIKKQLFESDFILLESNHDIDMLKYGPYPAVLKKRILSKHGHLSNIEAAKTMIDIFNGNKKHILLGHLSHENNKPELALNTMCTSLENVGIDVGKDIVVDMTWRDRISNIYTFK